MPDGLTAVLGIEGAPPMGLTLRMSECMRVIQQQVDATGVAPSYQELMDQLDLRSKQQVFRLVHSLIERGYLQHLPHRRRSLQVLRRLAAEPCDPTHVMSADLAERRGQ
jgi:repressor LexA